jgi:hypothetical protein
LFQLLEIDRKFNILAACKSVLQLLYLQWLQQLVVTEMVDQLLELLVALD